MASIHFICTKQAGVVRVAPPVYDSGDWDISTAEADQLIGGMLYLHETKRTPSYFGGRIESYRLVTVNLPHAQRVVFRLTSLVTCKGVRWKGADHGPAFTSGVVP